MGTGVFCSSLNKRNGYRKGAKYGTREDAYNGADREPAATGLCCAALHERLAPRYSDTAVRLTAGGSLQVVVLPWFIRRFFLP